jgi:hypothetical protein
LDAVLTPALARLGMAAAMTAGPPELRERLRLLEAGQLGEQERLVLLAELEAMAGLLGRLG